MALRDQPYIPLYVQDFLTDEKLNECSAEAVGVYIKIMCVMHKSKEYGVILLKQKDKQKDKQITNFALKLDSHMSFKVAVIESALGELIEEEVLRVDGDRLIQKRMVSDNDISTKRSLAGKKGGKKTQFAKANYEANSENEYVIESANKKDIKKALIEKLKKELQNLSTINPEVIGGELSDNLNLPFYGWESFLANTPVDDLELALNFLVSYDTEKV